MIVAVVFAVDSNNLGKVDSFRANMSVDVQADSLDPDILLSIGVAQCPYLLVRALGLLLQFLHHIH